MHPKAPLIMAEDHIVNIDDAFDCEVVIADIRMPGMSGVELLHEIRMRWPAVSVILLTGHGTLETAAEQVAQHLGPKAPGTSRDTDHRDRPRQRTGRHPARDPGRLATATRP